MFSEWAFWDAVILYSISCQEKKKKSVEDKQGASFI